MDRYVGDSRDSNMVASAYRRRPLACSIDRAVHKRRDAGLVCHGLVLLALCVPLVTHAQTFTTYVGPGAITSAVTVGAGTVTQVRGSTSITLGGSTNAATVSGGGWLVFDPSAGSLPGAITVQTASGTAVQNSNGQIDVSAAGLTVTTNNGIGFLSTSNNVNALAPIRLTAGATVNVNNGGAALGANGIAGNIAATDAAVNLNGGSATRGFVAQSGGAVTVNGSSSITASGAGINQLALGAAGTGSTVTVSTPIAIAMNSPGAIGVYMYGGGVVQLPQNQMFTFNAGMASGAVGMIVDGSQVPVDALGSGLAFHFNTTPPASGANGSSGVLVLNGGSVTINGLMVDGPDASDGVLVRDGSSATLVGGQIDLQSTLNGAYGALTNGKLLDPAGGSLAPSYSGNASLPNAALKSQGGTITASDTIVTTSAVGSNGGYAYALTNAPGSTTVYPIAALNLSNVQITTSGARAYGLYAGDGGQITGQAGTSVTSNNGAAALGILNYGTRAAPFIDLTNSTVTATSPQALYSDNRSGSQQNTVTLTGTDMQGSHWAIASYGPLLVTAQQGSSITSTSDLLLYAGVSGGPQSTFVQLNADDSTLSGLAGAEAQARTDITLTNHASWIGESFYVTNVNVDDTSTWTIPADSIVSNTLTNAGLVQFTPPDAYKQLYVGSYVGAGGTLGIHTFLGDDDSPTDRLIIDGGTASGHSFIAVTNTGGPGASTTANGIPVVEVLNGGTTAPGAFSLAGPVIAGPYEYTLERGGASAGTGDYWFLRNTISCGGSGNPACPPPPAPPVPPPVPGPEEAEAPVAPSVPNYRPEVSLYTAMPALALRYGWATLDNLHERVGEEEQLRDRPDLRSDNTLNALWVRVIGQDGNVQGSSQGIYGDGPKYDYTVAAFQAGMDIYAEEHENEQRDHAGLYLGAGRIRSDVTNYDDTYAGRDEIRGQSLGLYWTHFWQQGAYLDAVWQGTWSQWSAQSVDNMALKQSGFGWAGSLEGGYPFHDDSQVWEPQAQLIYQRVNDGQGNDTAATVRFTDINSLAGRLGLRWANTWTVDPTSEGIRRLFTGWLRFNVWKEFNGQPSTQFSSEDGFIPFQSNMKSTWWELNGGMTWQLDKNTSFYANVGYQRAFGGGFDAWDGKLGFRWNW